MVFVVDNFGSLPFVAVGGIQLSERHKTRYRLAGLTTENLGSTIELGYLLRNKELTQPDSRSSAKEGVISRPDPALLIRTMISELPSHGKSLESSVIFHWAATVRRPDLSSQKPKQSISTRLADGNPWCKELPPMEIDSMSFSYHYNALPFIADGIRFNNTWAFGTSVLWLDLPALLLVSGRGIEPDDLWFEAVGPEAMVELQGQPRLVLD